MPRSHKILFAVYILLWIITAIHPRYPSDWLLENVLPVTLFPLVVWLDYKVRFSFSALLLLLVFASLHAVGAHYTYAEVPFFEPIQHLFSLSRNDYDRVVHFLFGLLLFRPLFEILSRFVTNVKVTLWFTFSVVVSISAIYELLEWAAAMLFHPELGIAFLGIQGDVWDAQKDMLAANIGALVNIFLFYPLYKNFKKEHTDG